MLQIYLMVLGEDVSWYGMARQLFVILKQNRNKYITISRIGRTADALEIKMKDLFEKNKSFLFKTFLVKLQLQILFQV